MVDGKSHLQTVYRRLACEEEFHQHCLSTHGDAGSSVERSWRAARIACCEERSASITSTFISPLCTRISSRTASALLWLRATRMTVAPSCASAAAVALPMPDGAPVTIHILFCIVVCMCLSPLLFVTHMDETNCIQLTLEPVQNGTSDEIGGVMLHEVLGVRNGEQGPGVLKPLPGVVECCG